MAAVLGVEAVELAASALAESGVASAVETGLATAAESGVAKAAESGLATAAESGAAKAAESGLVNVLKSELAGSAEKSLERAAVKETEKAIKNTAVKESENIVETKLVNLAKKEVESELANTAESKVVNAAESKTVEKAKKEAEAMLISEKAKNTSINPVKTRKNNPVKTRKNNPVKTRKNNGRNLVLTDHNCDAILGIPRTKESKKIAKEIKRNYRTLKNGMKLYYNKKATCLDENINAQENELKYLKTTTDNIPKYARRKRATTMLRRNIRELEDICTEKLSALCRLTPDLLKTIKSKKTLTQKDKDALELFNILNDSIQICGSRRYCMNNRIKLRNIYSDALRVLSTMQNQFLGSYF